MVLFAIVRFIVGNSSVTSSSGSLSSPGSASLQQQSHFNAAKGNFTQGNAYRDNSINQGEFRQWAQGGQQAQ